MVEEQNKRKSIVYLTIGVLTLIALVVGATYAFFQAQNKNGTSFNTNVTAGTTDNLTFSINDLNVGYDNITDDDGNNGMVINATQENFKSGDNSIGDGVTGNAILIANDSSKEAEFKYNVYVNIINNELEYSSYTKGNEIKEFKTREEKEGADLEGYTPVPELVMTIRKNDKPYTEEIEGIKQTTITTKDGDSVTGYDITEVKRNILIKEETIKVTKDTSDLRAEDEWEISIILKNLESNQQINTDKEVKGEVIIQREKIEPIETKLLADANKEGKETLLYHNGEIKINEEVMDAEDYSYRYAGSSEEVNNYICFGGTCSNKPEEEEKYSNLYRIIGLFPTDSSHTTYQMKIIKADYATEAETGGTGIGAYYGKYIYGSETYKGNKELYYPKIESYYWNKSQNNSGDGTNDWSKSNLNTENLNKKYLNYIQRKDSEKWYNMIEKHEWITAGNTYQNIIEQNAKNTYINEIKKPNVGTRLPTAAETYQARVGLMYASDYMYGATKESWATIGNSYDSVVANNWLYMGIFEWTITRVADYSDYAIRLRSVGNTGQVGVNIDYLSVIRPTMYLNSNVKIIDGDGTSTNPYIIFE